MKLSPDETQPRRIQAVVYGHAAYIYSVRFTSFSFFFLICGDQLSTAPRYATTAAGVYMEQCVHALKMRALRPLREKTYLRVQVHVTAYVAPAVADDPKGT